MSAPRPLSEKLDRWSLALLCLWSAAMLLKLVLANAADPESILFRLQVWPLLAGYLITDRLADEARAEERNLSQSDKSDKAYGNNQDRKE